MVIITIINSSSSSSSMITINSNDNDNDNNRLLAVPGLLPPLRQLPAPLRVPRLNNSYYY